MNVTRLENFTDQVVLEVQGLQKAGLSSHCRLDDLSKLKRSV